MSKTKQILVVRKDLGMGRGKEIAQCCHASMAILTRNGYVSYDGHGRDYFKTLLQENHAKLIKEWLESSFTKITLQVSSEQELLDIYNKAKEAGILCSLITDNGQTVFKGVPTNTCCAIGPDYPEKIDPITGHLKPY